MSKQITPFTYTFLGAILLTCLVFSACVGSGLAYASGTDFQFSSDFDISLTGSGLTVTIASGSSAASFSVGTATLTLNLDSGSNVTVKSTSFYTLSNTLSQTTQCASGYSYVTFTGGGSPSNVVITPSSTVACSLANPVATVTAPTSGSTVGGTNVTLSAIAVPSQGNTISQVQFQVDGANVGSPVTTSPYNYAWDSTSVSDGSHTITAIATDSGSRQGTSAGVIVTVRNTPPVLSNGSPSGTLPYGTTSATLTLTTDENATCKYDTTSGTAYASMPNTFTTTGSANQSTSITGLSSGNSYSYYVRCQDTLGNTDSVDYLITFNISSGGGGGGGSIDVTPPSIPTHLSALAVSQTEIDLSWAASTDNVGVTGYHVYRNGAAIATTQVTHYNDSVLQPSTTYSYSVSAYDAASNVSAQSSPVSATTPGSGQTTDIRFGQNILIDHTVYYIDPSGKKRPYTSAGGFLSFGFNSFADVLTPNQDEQNLPTGAFVYPMEGSLINDHGTVYVITSGERALAAWCGLVLLRRSHIRSRPSEPDLL